MKRPPAEKDLRKIRKSFYDRLTLSATPFEPTHEERWIINKLIRRGYSYLNSSEGAIHLYRPFGYSGCGSTECVSVSYVRDKFKYWTVKSGVGWTSDAINLQRCIF